jgi:hypothetical protein
MIHQCYFDASQRDRLFGSPLYCGFGLYATVNPDIARNCPELADPAHQQMLSEYAAMLHLWRNPELDADPWVGFTSYRQLDKFPTIFSDRDHIERVLKDHDVLGWGGYVYVELETSRKISLAEQGERHHPGITSCLYRLLLGHRQAMPEHYLLDNRGLYCNYWIMSRANFNSYMQWSMPLVTFCLSNPDPYVQSHPRSLSYLAERLFICWYALHKKRVWHEGGLRTLVYRASSGAPQLDSQPDRRSELARTCEKLLVQRVYHLCCDGQPPHTLEFLEAGIIGQGRSECAQSWKIHISGNDIVLEVAGGDVVSFRFRQMPDLSWRGNAVDRPGVAISLLPSVNLRR